eukprot:4377334-Pyramimonas_sp.AAC.2
MILAFYGRHMYVSSPAHLVWSRRVTQFPIPLSIKPERKEYIPEGGTNRLRGKSIYPKGGPID